MAVNSDLESYVGKAISEICECNFSSPHQNHCAHFVSHALGIKISTLCGDMAYQTRRTGATIRCNELYNGLQKTGPWSQKPNITPLLIFCTKKTNMSEGRMGDHPRKHVGIYTEDGVYNFSNSRHRVVKDASADAFFEKMDHAYGGDTAIFFAVPA